MENAAAILVTDDNPENLRVLVSVLEPAGYEVRVATTGEQAMASIEAAAPDLLLLDIQLPQMDGYEVCRRVRANPECGTIPIVFISAAAAAFNKQQAFEAGGDDYITKPFQAEEVLARVKTHLDAFKYRCQLEDQNVVLAGKCRSAFEQAAVGIVYVDPATGRFSDANQRFCDMTGYEREELLARTVASVTHPDSVAEDSRMMQRLAAGSIREVVREMQYVRKDGAVFWVKATASFVRFDSPLTPDCFVAVVEDISDRKKAESELAQAFDEIKTLKEQTEAENVCLREEIKLSHLHGDIVGTSDGMRAVLSQAEQVAPTGSTVLILGETGTGKELLARAVHNMSDRSDNPLVIVNCAALPPDLVESELFGREKGAYTGALTKQIGRFEAANGGSIFLDEIGELPAEAQAKLLRVLQEGQFERLGSTVTTSVDVRVIVATNRDLEEMTRQGGFRQDLFFRLNVYPITIPPLRDRRKDIEVLVWAFVNEFSTRMGKRIETISQADMDGLRRYDWPGNVRELRNVIERAMILADGVSLKVKPPGKSTPESTVVDESSTLADVQRRHIKNVLKSTGWRIRGDSGAARILGINPSTLESRMSKLGISRPGRNT